MTEYLKVSADSPSSEAIERAARALRAGGLVAFPTETVYGLGALSSSREGEPRLRELKGRPPPEPFTRLIADFATAREIAGDLPAAARLLMRRYWPGPLTLVVPGAMSPSETLGLRLPAHPVAVELVRALDAPLLAPSANPRDEPPATSAEEVREYFDGKIDVVLDAGPAMLGEPSAVVRITDSGPEVVREGLISRAMIERLVSGRRYLFVCTGNTCRSPMAAALFRKLLAEKLGSDEAELAELGFHVESAGTFAFPGGEASDGSRRAMEEKGCDISAHQSRPVTPELLREADEVWTMTRSQLELLRQLDPDSAPRVRLLAEQGVPDPVGGDIDTYRECAARIGEAIARIVEEA